MEVCVKQGEIVNKHLKLEMNIGDVLCYGLDEKLVCTLHGLDQSRNDTSITHFAYILVLLY